MLKVQPFTIISGGVNGVDLEAERLARDYNLAVKILIHLAIPEVNTWLR